jgi:hypothetical protein
MQPLFSVLQSLPFLLSLPKAKAAQTAQFAPDRVEAKVETLLQTGETTSQLCFLLEGHLQGLDLTSWAPARFQIRPRIKIWLSWLIQCGNL